MGLKVSGRWTVEYTDIMHSVSRVAKRVKCLHLWLGEFFHSIEGVHCVNLGLKVFTLEDITQPQ